MRVLPKFACIIEDNLVNSEDEYKMKNLETWKLRFMKSHYISLLFLVALATAAFYLRGGNVGIPAEQEQQNQTLAYHLHPIAVNETSSCNLFSGRWVYDNVSYPLYQETECSFMVSDYACERYGRKDVEYQSWRWQPHHCDLPRFNGSAFLEKIRGKRLVFVGDSLNKNQWISLLCLIQSSLHQSSNKSITRQDNLFIFRASEYNVTIEFYWSPLLVESNCDDPYNHSISDRVIKITAIDKHARHWTDADILIFDAFMWWLKPTMTLIWGSFGSSDAVYKKVEMGLRRFEIVLNTWSDWLEININSTKTELFFMSLSPYHIYGEMWGVQQNCYNETEPIGKEDYWGVATDREMMRVVESVITKLETRGVKVEYLNITQLSDYRKDAHPSIYRNFFHPLSEDQLADPKSYSDCVHWCLPGVPDVWNHILYSYIMKP